MKREIKFRCFFYDGIDTSNGAIISANEAFREDYIEFLEDGSLIPTDNCTAIMQFTGLKDKNGKEIYEGDIIKGGVRSMEVKYKQEACQYWLVWNDGKIHRYEPLTANYGDEDGCANDALEVIGNIYENPNSLSL